MDLTYWEIALRVGLSVVAGGLIGFERELHVQPAGLRTHLLVSMGACAFTLAGVSLQARTRPGSPRRSPPAWGSSVPG